MKILIFLFLFLFSSFLKAQDLGPISVDIQGEKIIVNSLEINAGTEIKDVIREFGKPERIEKIAGRDRVYAYDTKGVAFSIQPGESWLIESVTLTYNFDSDKKVAKEEYQGKLKIEELEVSEKTTPGEIEEKTSVDNIACFGNLCVTDPKQKGLVLMIGQTAENEISQIGFAFKSN